MKRQFQAGSHHVVLTFVAVVALIGVLGFVGYNAWQKKNANAAGEASVGQTVTPDAYTYTNNLCENNAKDGLSVYTKVTVPKNAVRKLSVKIDGRETTTDLAKYAAGTTQYIATKFVPAKKDTAVAASQRKPYNAVNVQLLLDTKATVVYVAKSIKSADIGACIVPTAVKKAALENKYGARGLCYDKKENRLYVSYPAAAVANSKKLQLYFTKSGNKRPVKDQKYLGFYKTLAYQSVIVNGDTFVAKTVEGKKVEWIAGGAALTTVRNCK